jgi:hypothetical protein
MCDLFGDPKNHQQFDFFYHQIWKTCKKQKTAWVKMCPLNQRLEPDPPLRAAIVAPGVAWSHKHFSPYAAADQRRGRAQ